jgi:hypothetical protein
VATLHDPQKFEGAPAQATEGKGSGAYRGNPEGPGVPTEAPPVYSEPLVLSILTEIRAGLKKLDVIPIIQQHLEILGRQIDSLTVLQTRSFGATLRPEAATAATDQARKQAEDLERQIREEEDALIDQRGGDHPPTPEEREQWRRERMLS